MNAKKKMAAVTGCSGVTGVFDEPMEIETRSEGGGLEKLTRARVAHPILPVTPVTEDEVSTQVLISKEESLSPVDQKDRCHTGDNRCHPKSEADRRGDDEVAALAWPVVLWAGLPLPSSLEVRTRGGHMAWLTSSRSRAQDATARGQAVFRPVEYEAAVLATLEGRASPALFDAWVARKLERPAWILSALEAVDGAVSLLDASAPKLVDQRVRRELLAGVTWERALEVIGCDLVRIEIEQPAPSVGTARPNLEVM